jgi:hypothetical protein
MPLRHEIVALVTEHADDLRCKRLVQQPQHHAAVGVVAGSHRALRDVLPGPLAQRLDVGEERSGHQYFFGFSGAAGAVPPVAARCWSCFASARFSALPLARSRSTFACLMHASLASPFWSSHFCFATSYGGFGLGLAHLLLRLRLVLVVLGVELGLGDLLLAFRLGHADVLGVGLERVALGLVGFRLRLDALVLGLVDLALVHLLACAEAANATPTASAMLVMDSFIGTP